MCFVCVNQRDLRETSGVSIEYSCVFIFPQITQITQTNAAGCIISQRKTGWSWCGFEVLLFVCVNLRDLRETLGFLLSALTCLFSRRLRRLRRGIQLSCIITQRKTGCLRLRLFCCFGVCPRKSARSAGDFGVSIEHSCVKN